MNADFAEALCSDPDSVLIDDQAALSAALPEARRPARASPTPGCMRRVMVKLARLDDDQWRSVERVLDAILQENPQ